MICSRTLSRLFSLIPLLLSGYIAGAVEPLSLSDLLRRAQEKNQDILAARHGWKVKSDEVSPTSAWPDPTFSFVDEKFPSGMSGVDPEHIQHNRVEQMI